MLKGCIFDLDGTLIDSMYIYEDLSREMLGEAGFEMTDEIRAVFRTSTLQQMATYCVDVLGVDMTEDEIIGNVVLRIIDFYENEVKVKPGVPELLEELSKRNVEMCIVSVSERRIVEAALKRNGIDKYFNGIITCGEAGMDKRNPEIYRKAMEFLGTSKTETAVFEDEVHTVKTAKDDGFTVFAVADDSVPEKEEVIANSDIYITDFNTQLYDILNYL